MQKTIKILFDVSDPRYRERFYGLTEQIREVQVPLMCRPFVDDFIQDWKSIFEKYNIPSQAICVKYVGEHYIFE